MSSVKIDAVQIDMSVYPREKWNTATVERYADALRAGVKFPPITLEQGTNRLLDGMHRLKAYQKVAEQPELCEDGFKPDGTIPADFDQIPEGVPPKLYAASLSARHGDRLTGPESRALARELYEANPDFKQQEVVRWLSVSAATVSTWVSDITARKREERMVKAGRLQMLGWTKEETAEHLGVNPDTVTEDRRKFSELKNSVCAFLASRGALQAHVVVEAAKRFGMPVTLAWAMALEGKADEERMDALGIKTQPYDVWHFSKCHDLMGKDYPGRIPGELVAHVLYFFTKPGDTILDPMAGSGTTQDACLLMGRKCYAYDINMGTDRFDVLENDIAKSGWPGRAKDASLIFWDPPYFDKKDNGYADGSISRLEREPYMGFFHDAFNGVAKATKPGTRIVLLMSDWDAVDAPAQGIFLWDYADVIRKAGLILERQIQVPLTTERVHPDIVNKFRASRRLARLERYILVAVKS